MTATMLVMCAHIYINSVDTHSTALGICQFPLIRPSGSHVVGTPLYTVVVMHDGKGDLIPVAFWVVALFILHGYLRGYINFVIY